MSAQNPPVDATSVNGAPVIVSPPQTVDDENHQMDDVEGSNEGYYFFCRNFSV